jgi:hypothetical protein
MTEASRLRGLVTIGALQGGWLWALAEAAGSRLWPATEPTVFAAAAWVGMATPLAIYLSAGVTAPSSRRLCVVTAVLLLYALLGAFAGWGAVDPSVAARPGWEAVGSAGALLAAAALLFALVPLAMVWRRGPIISAWDYPSLFELAWRNAVLCASAAAVAGLFWIVVWAGAFLMESVGLKFVREVIGRPSFAYISTATVVGAAFALGLRRAEALVALRRFWLALCAWLYPMLAVFALMWVAALPITGLAPLLATKSAAFILLWFVALTIKFCNAAWQDGLEPPYPRWARRLAVLSWAAVVVIVVVAAWALAQRVAQHGWSEDRVWAAFVTLLAAGYAFGYTLSLLPRWGRNAWMGSVGGTNVAVAVVMVLGLALLLSPLADPRRIAAQDQVARLQQGAVGPTQLDYRYLRFDAGRYGVNALQALAGGAQGEGADRARQALAQRERYVSRVVHGLDRAGLRQRVRVVPAGQQLDNEFLDRLLASSDWRDRPCLLEHASCVAWLHDFDGDGSVDLLLAWPGQAAMPHNGGTRLYTRRDGPWQPAGSLGPRVNHVALVAAMLEARVVPLPARWPDLQIGGQRVPILVDPD